MTWNKVKGSFQSQVRAWESLTQSIPETAVTLWRLESQEMGRGADSRAAQTDSQSFFVCENAFHWPLQDSIVRNSHRGSNLARPVWQSRFHRPLSGRRSQYGLRGLGLRTGGSHRMEGQWGEQKETSSPPAPI